MSRNTQTLVKFDDWVASVDRDNDKLIRKVVRVMWLEAMRRTPLWTGWMLHNWKARNHPSAHGKDHTNKMRPPWSPKGALYMPAQSEGKFSTKRTVYLFNPVPYAVHVDEANGITAGMLAAARNTLGS